MLRFAAALVVFAVSQSAFAVDVQLLCRGPIRDVQVHETFTFSPQNPSTPVLTFKVFANAAYRVDGGPFGRDLQTGECSIMGPNENLRVARFAIDVSLATMRHHRQPNPNVFTFSRVWNNNANKWDYSVPFLYGLESQGLFRVYAERTGTEGFILRTNMAGNRPPVDRIQ